MKDFFDQFEALFLGAVCIILSYAAMFMAIVAMSFLLAVLLKMVHWFH